MKILHEQVFAMLTDFAFKNFLCEFAEQDRHVHAYRPGHEHSPACMPSVRHKTGICIQGDS